MNELFATVDHSVVHFAEQLKQSSDPFAVLEQFQRDRGVRGFRYGYMLLRAEAQRSKLTDSFFAADNLPQEWRSKIATGNHFDNDPAVHAFLAGATHFDWFPPGFRDVIRQMTPAQRQLVEAELDMGMMYGMSLSLGTRGGPLSAMDLWFADQSSRSAFEAAWQRFGQSLSITASLFDQHLRLEKPNTLIGLSNRELDCLSFLLAGLRPAEISWKLTISEKTFEKHISNAKRKLKARTRDQALAKALAAGLLQL